MPAIYIISKIDGNTYCKTNGHFTKHLRSHGYTYKDYYETFITKVTPLCMCGKPLSFYQATETYKGTCGNYTCVGKLGSQTKQNWTPEQREKDSISKKTSLSLRTPEQIKASYGKSVQTLILRYGPDWKDKQQQKVYSTKEKRYGSKDYNNIDKILESFSLHTENKLNQIAETRRNTNLLRYGVENTFLLPGNSSKSNTTNNKVKNYTFPSGRIAGVRGFEPVALSILLNDGYTEDNIKIHNAYERYDMEVFTYVNVNKKISKYYPDIFIISENKYIEIKGMFWWDGNGLPKYRSRIENNLRKRQAVLDKGYTYEVWLFSSKHSYTILKNEEDFIKYAKN